MSNVWFNKEQNAINARIHTSNMANRYGEQINHSIMLSKTYSPDSVIIPNYIQDTVLNVEIMDTDSVSAAKRFADSNMNVCILNFASYKHPGGMFINGSMAQEECICHASDLYNILTAFSNYYEWNKKNLNRSMYTNRAIYTPDVVFENFEDNGKDIKNINFFSVLTCASPNLSPSLKYGNAPKITKEENHTILESRIKFVLDIMSENKVDIPILGAFGCGVFKQDPHEVARTFMNILQNNSYGFKKVIFAIPGGPNLAAFRKVIGK